MEVSMISHLDRFKVLIKSNICKAWPIEDGLWVLVPFTQDTLHLITGQGSACRQEHEHIDV